MSISSKPTTVSVIVIGAGFAGLGTAIRLKQAGIHDFVVLESGDDVGGTWRDNTYPGAACDIPSHLYSFSFEPRPDWSRAYAPQDEIQAYLVHCADRYGIRDHLYLGRWVTSARFEETAARWHVVTSDGEAFIADAVVAAIGGLRDPAYPALAGRDLFEGASMHSARWDHGVDLKGKRVGVIGTGASAIQLVPAIADDAEHVTLFQRTPPWVLPRHDRPYTRMEKQVFRRLPAIQRLHRTAIYLQKEARFVGFGRFGEQLMKPMEARAKRYLRSQVRDPELRRMLTPDYQMGCKRILIADDYHQALGRDDVEVVTDGIREVTPTGVLLDSGSQVELDVIVYATGFQVDRPLGALEVAGLAGRDLAATWGARPLAYLGMTIPGFPNLFLMVGPNTGLGHNSIVFMIESQLNYVIPAIQRILDREIAYLDVTQEALDGFADEIDRRSANSVWESGCESWYLGKDGINFTLWPGSTVEYRLRTRRFDPRPYRTVRREDLPDPVRVLTTA